MYLPLIAAFIAISGSIGVSYMTADALPGEPLYSIKIHLNEGIKRMADLGAGVTTPGSLEAATSSEEERSDSLSSSSSSIYLDGSSADEASSSDKSSDSNTDIDASTSLDASKVINSE